MPVTVSNSRDTLKIPQLICLYLLTITTFFILKSECRSHSLTNTSHTLTVTQVHYKAQALVFCQQTGLFQVLNIVFSDVGAKRAMVH